MYDDDKYGVEKTMTVHSPVPPGDLDDNEVIARIVFFNRTKLLEARAMIVTTAYNNATCTLQLYKDDGSIGAIVVADGAVGSTVDASLTDTTFDTTNSLEIQLNSEATQTGLCDIVLQYQEQFY